MFKKIMFLALITGLLCPAAALADLYAGAAIGNTWQSAKVDAEEVLGNVTEISENSTGWKIFGGFKGQGIFAIEGGYRDLGEIETEPNNIKFTTNTKGWDVEAMAHLEVSILDLFAKAGAFFWKSDSVLGTMAEENSGTSFLWGLGVGVTLGPVGVRLEWESMEVDQMDNLSMLSLGASLGF